MTKTYRSYDQLPLALNAEDIAQVLGISRSNAYTLMHAKDFPTTKIGNRVIARKDLFLIWLDRQTACCE